MNHSVSNKSYSTFNRISHYLIFQSFRYFLLLAVNFLVLSAVYATDVSGNLIDNDTWTKANSPYNIVGDVGVPSGLTLTIEPGVEVNYTGDFRILVFGAIQVNGVEGDSVIFNGNSEEGAKYMLEVRRTNLEDSKVDYARFEGPQGAVLQGKPDESPVNYGELRMSNVSFSNSLLQSNPMVLSSESQDSISKIEVRCYYFNDGKILGTQSQNNGFGIKLINGVLKGSEFSHLTTSISIENSKITNLRISGSAEINDFQTINSDIINSSLAIPGPGGAGEELFPILKNVYIDSCRIIQTSFATHNLTLKNSVLVNSNQSKGAIELSENINGSRSLIENVQILGNNSGIGVYITRGQKIDIFNSSFNNFNSAIHNKSISANDVVVSSCNFYNSAEYHIDNPSGNVITAQSNYWGSDSPTVIASKIYDQNDNLELGLVDFSNFLTEPNIKAPISPPDSAVLTDNGEGSVHIQWAENPESDVAGYKIYYRLDSGKNWYLDNLEVIDVGNVTSYILSGLSLADSIAVTAYDSDADGASDMAEGHESWYGFGKAPNSIERMSAYYPFDGNGNDESGNNNHATISGVRSAEDRFGNSNSALFFDNQYWNNSIKGSDSKFPSGNEPRTISIWCKLLSDRTNTSTNGVDIFRYGGYQENGYRFGLGESSVEAVVNTNSYFRSFTGYDDRWHLIVSSYDGSNYMLYVDGNLIMNESVTADTQKTGEFQVGNGDAGIQNGYVDDLRVYNYALSEEEINELYTEGGWPLEPENQVLDGVVGYYPIRGNANDESVYGNHGTVEGAVLSIDRFEKRDEAYMFNTVDDEITTSVSHTIGESMALAVWIKVDTESSIEPYFINEEGSLGHTFSLSLTPTFEVDFNFWDNTEGKNSFISNQPLQNNTWTHVLINLDGSQGRLELYINGELDSYNDACCLSGILNNADSRIIGGNLQSKKLVGSLDEIIIFNKSLSEDEIKSIYKGSFEIESGNNTPPTISNQTFYVDENSPVGSTVGTVVATDSDGDALAFTLMGGNTNNAFELAYDGGKITVNNQSALDYETNPEFTLNVDVWDGFFTSSATITINLNDINENSGNNAPIISNQTFSINENSPFGTTVGTVQANDPDSDQLTFSIISGNTSNAFTIGASSGVLTVYSQSALDYEATPIFNLTVQVTDGEYTRSAMITVNLNDINESINNAPFIANQTFSIIENAAVNSLVGTVAATDQESSSLSFYLISGNTNNAFAINSNTGFLTVNNASQLDYETTPNFSLGVEVSDGQKAANALLTVNLINVEEVVTSPIQNQSLNLIGGSGSSIKNYNIISFPFRNPNVTTQFDELGVYDKENWRLFRLMPGTENYQEYSSDFTIVRPGVGYWFIQKEPNEIIVEGTSVEIVEGLFKMDLFEGYNLIGNPYVGSLDWRSVVQHNLDEGIITEDDIRVENLSDIFVWRTAWLADENLNSFEGGYVYANRLIQGFEVPFSASQNNSNRFHFSLPTVQGVSIENPDWEIKLFLQSPEYDYYLASIGLNPNAEDDQDEYDGTGVPRFGKYLEMNFDGNLTKSIKKTDDLKNWTFRLPNNLHAKMVRMSWDIPQAVNKSVFLIDGATHQIYDMGEDISAFLSTDPSIDHYIYYGNVSDIFESYKLPFDVINHVYPNPVNDRLNLQIYSSGGNLGQIEIISVSGKSVLKEFVEFKNGINLVSLDLHEMGVKSGIYLLKFNDSYQTRIIKL